MEYSVSNGITLLASSSHDSQSYVEQEAGRLKETELMDDSKETVSSRHNRTDSHLNSEILGICARPVEVKASLGPRTASGR